MNENKLLISLICLKYIALLEKQNLLTKNGNGARDVLGDYESVTVPVGRDRKIRTALRANQIAGFVTVPSEKKNLSTVCSNLKVFLFFFLEYCRGADGKSGNNYNNKKAGHGREEWVVFLFCFMVNLLI